MDGSRARALLRVRPNASTDEIRRAFRGAVRAAHPDRGGDPGAFRALVAARDLLLGAASPAGRTPEWSTAEPSRPTIDLVDITRPRPAGVVTVVPAPDFDALLEAALAA